MSHPPSSCTAARTLMQMLQKWRLCCSSMCCCSIFMDGLGFPPLGSQMAHEYAVMSCVHTESIQMRCSQGTLLPNFEGSLTANMTPGGLNNDAKKGGGEHPRRSEQERHAKALELQTNATIMSAV